MIDRVSCFIFRLGYTYCNNIDKIIFPQSVQNGDDGVFGNGHPQTLHAPTDVHHDYNVLGRGGCLDVPLQDWERREAGTT